MRHRTARIPLWAWVASAALHAVAGAALYMLLPSTPRANSVTQADDVPVNPFNLSFAQPSDEPPADAIPVRRPAPRPDPEPTPEPGRVPTVSVIPATIPDDFKGILRDIVGRPTPEPQARATDFPLPEFPADMKPVADIRPVEHTAPTTPPTPTPAPAAKKLAGGKPIHGPLPDGTVAVYLFDRSASMGLNRDTFDAARAALLATVNETPVGANFQVLTYHTAATPALRGTAGKLLTAGEDVTRRFTEVVVALKAEGDSAHEPALKAAIALGADYIIWITDASDEELAKAARALKAARKPVAVYIARAGNGTVAEPVELR